MALSAAFKLVATKLQEAAATELSSNDLCKWLSDALHDLAEDNEYTYYIDHVGDSTSGDVVYCCNGDMWKAPYSCSMVNGKINIHIDDDKAIDVLPRTTYEPQVDDEDHYASMEAAKLYVPGQAKLAERFISKDERDKADDSSFAGKGKSFPILKSGDAAAAAKSIGRAGPGNLGSAALKRNIIAIAKKKGLSGELPDTWKDGDSKEAAATATADARLVEAAAFSAEINLREAATSALNPLVKIISPGRGTTGYYTEALLKRDGPEIFKRGTLMYINHATPAEEAARPEGDYSKLAAVTTGDAYWDANGKDGAALYAPAKVFAGVAAEVADKAPYTGISINARGQYAEAASGLPKAGLKAAESKIAPDGKPGLIGKLTGADSIDLVTKAGRDGKLLLESAVENPQQGAESDMDEATAKKILESNRKLHERLALNDARTSASQQLETVRLPDATKKRLIERLVGMAPTNAEGDLDTVAFKTLLEAEVKDEAAYLSSLTGGQIVTGMGDAGQGSQPTPEQIAEAEKDRKRDAKRFAESMGFGKGTLGRRIMIEGRGSFDPNYNSALNGVGVTAVED